MIRRLLIPITALALLLFPATVTAGHSWGPYHWSRSANPFNLNWGDNVTSAWDPFLSTASSDWSQSSVLDTTIIPGGTTARRCRATLGRVEICNYTYGRNGWLGLAQIWVSGDHITQGVAKLNDTYFNTKTYDTPAWRAFVMCQETGHLFGLDHQDETFNNANLGSCMDYTNKPSGPPSNEHPNSHDFAQLETIYSHLDAQSQTSRSPAKKSFPRMTIAHPESIAEWGRAIRDNGRVALFEQTLDATHKILTFVIWAH